MKWNQFNNINDVYLVLVSSISLSLPFVLAFNYDSISNIDIFIFSLISILLGNIHLNTTLHNHVHSKIFKSQIVNRIFEYLTIGSSMVANEEYKYIHIEHHKFCNDKIINGKVSDPISTFRFGKNGNEESFLSYIFKSPFRNYILSDDLNPRRIRMDFSKFKNELYFKYFIIFIICLINIKFLPLYVLITYLTWVVNSANSYCEHHNAKDLDDTKRDSVSCYNSVYNFLLFNSGYHQEHHYRPGCHWTKLPEIAKQLPLDRTIVKYTLFNNNPFR